jgi:putative phosphoribosyl transferase
MFANRQEAGEALGKWLKERLPRTDIVVLGIPRGGVLIAVAVAKILEAELDIIVPRKIRAPEHRELAIGAMAVAGGEEIVLLDKELVRRLTVPAEYLDGELQHQREEISRRVDLFRRVWPERSLAGRTVVIVDDGVATGQTARAAAMVVRRAEPAEALVAVPVAPPETVEEFRDEGLRLEALATPKVFMAVGQFYADFHVVTDDEALAALTGTENGIG